MVVRLETVPGHAEKELYFPDIDSKKDQAKQELADRAKNATSGMCKFIIHQACWRMESS
jgi:hypothetical protein